MALDADTLLDRIQLKSKIARWRTLAIVLGCAALIAVFGKIGDVPLLEGDHIARVTIAGELFDQDDFLTLLEELGEDPHVKAVILELNTPGGSAITGQELYLATRKLNGIKPVVAVMRDICASAGYLTAVGTDYILAREGTITGSIGVVLESLEFTELAEKIGATPIILKSGDHKATGGPLEKLGEPQRKQLQSLVDDFYRYFSAIVIERRKLNEAQSKVIADGRVFSGTQALDAKLIDALGGEEEAVTWLEKTHKIDASLEIIDAKPPKEFESFFEQFEQMAKQSVFFAKNLSVTLDGLQAIWHPAFYQH